MIYLFLADGFEEVEALTVVDLLRRAQCDVKTVSVTGEKTVRGTHDIYVVADGLFEDFEYSQAELLVLPGGMPGTANLMEHKGLAKVLTARNEEGKRIAAICAAPMVLGKLGILKGKKAICYPGCEENLTGATIVKADAVTDLNITTSRGPATAFPFALELIKILKGDKVAKTISDDTLYS